MTSGLSGPGGREVSGSKNRYLPKIRSCGQIPRAPSVVNAPVAREVDAGSCAQGGVRRSVAGIVVGEKKPLHSDRVSGAWSVAVWRRSLGLAGTITGATEGTGGGRVSRELVYT